MGLPNHVPRQARTIFAYEFPTGEKKVVMAGSWIPVHVDKIQEMLDSGLIVPDLGEEIQKTAKRYCRAMGLDPDEQVLGEIGADYTAAEKASGPRSGKVQKGSGRMMPAWRLHRAKAAELLSGRMSLDDVLTPDEAKEQADKIIADVKAKSEDGTLPGAMLSQMLTEAILKAHEAGLLQGKLEGK